MGRGQRQAHGMKANAFGYTVRPKQFPNILNEADELRVATAGT